MAQIREDLAWVINLGIVLVVVLLAWIIGPSAWMETNYRSQVRQYGRGNALKGFGALISSTEDFNQQLKEIGIEKPISSQFGLVIPKIFVNVSVTENVDASDVKKYQSALRRSGGVAHAAGTAVPDEMGAMYIFGHSTDFNFNVERFNAVFYLLNKLEKKDLIVVSYNGVLYKYRVAEKKIVGAKDISEIVNPNSRHKLVLQTCWPPGTTWKRLLIIAGPE